MGTQSAWAYIYGAQSLCLSRRPPYVLCNRANVRYDSTAEARAFIRAPPELTLLRPSRPNSYKSKRANGITACCRRQAVHLFADRRFLISSQHPRVIIGGMFSVDGPNPSEVLAESLFERNDNRRCHALANFGRSALFRFFRQRNERCHHSFRLI